MGALFQPINQVKFTNVAIVKYKHKGKKFEIACYKNKIIDWRNGTELNIDDVLQSHLIFTNISKGEIAKKSELSACFNTDNNYEICKTILEKGTLQISNKERTILKEKIYKDIIEILHEMSVNPQTGYPLSTNMIESMVKNLGYSINIDDSAKKQALKVFDILSKEYDEIIQRAFMRIQIICDDIVKDEVIKFLNSNNVIIEEQEVTNNMKSGVDNVNIKHNHEYEHNNVEENIKRETNTYENSMDGHENDSTCVESQLSVQENGEVIHYNAEPKSVNMKGEEKYETENKDGNYNDGYSNCNGYKYEDKFDHCENPSNSNNDTNIRVSKYTTRRKQKDTQEKDKPDEPKNVFDINDTAYNERDENFSKKDKKEKNVLLHNNNFMEEKKKNLKKENSVQNDDIKASDSFSDDLKIKFKQKKNKQDKERKEKFSGTHKIVFLCYPCVYRYIHDLTKKYKKNCSSKILSNNVKIATFNKKKKNDRDIPVILDVHIENTTEKSKTKGNKNICNGNTKGKGKCRINQSDNEKDGWSYKENEQEFNGGNENKEGITKSEFNSINNSNSNIILAKSGQKLNNEIKDNINGADIIMCTSCLTRIEKSNYKLHCRSDFHVYNVKRKYKKLPPISLEEYKEIDFDVSHFHVDM
ncbi:ribosome maturation protein SBDS [Plasmodium brasilianum]|uniref:Ribosome maturation protein SBDS, putative n=2 Tax=Plasmodium (Plasmodium) TaxID=418103 RepID=A0A1A8WAB9_PLAMA|nr:ribosome maturation protein SBDS, putative [Plasmodium malariae]KAI4835891.1 ribosome maturation protein SBDS [Plasmodium brasilianum]SBS89800.1 hypothetical protein PMALA_027440 [Plasmodium malariae]SCP02828.1 ribosome maturation protein SBDS, putative [Plasmodium malariae]